MSTVPSDGSAGDERTVVVADPPERVDRSALAVPRGASIGRYVVLDEAGSGGMGRVLRAYDPKLQREVALKDVGARRLVAAASQRLVAEARAMAKLSHANVVTVYDVEEVADATTLGPFVLVMEFVSGRTLRVWLTERPRTWQEIVAHFADAGRGLAAAHAVGLLHRDFKPTNVLVSDGDIVKVTDFGLAKLDVSLSASDADEGEFLDVLREDASMPATATGIVMGSPRYMAPEQHTRRSLTVAADQYAFCVALWEALVGEPPFLGTTFGGLLGEKRRGPPAFPRSAVPRHVADAVRRGLAPEPEQRWPSMHALLAALTDDPVKRRRRWIVVGAGVTAIAIVGVAWQSGARPCTGADAELAGVWDDDARTRVKDGIVATATPYAEHVWTWTASTLDAYATQWQAAHTDACEASAIRREQSTEIMDRRMACLHRAKLELQAVTNVLAHADAKTVEQAHLAVGGLPALSRCSDLDALQADVEPPLPEDVDAVELARMRLAEARAADTAGRFAQAEEAIDAAAAALAGVDYEPAAIELAIVHGQLFASMGKLDEAEAQLRAALEGALAVHEWSSMFRATTELMHVVGYRQHRPEEAMRYRELAAALSRNDPLREAGYRKNLGLMFVQQRKPAEAEAEIRKALALLEQALGSEDLQVAVAHNHLAGALHEQGRDIEAETEYRRVLLVRERVLGPEHPLVASSRSNLALIMHALGRSAEGEVEARAAIAILERAYGPDHAEMGRSQHNLGLMLEAQGKDDEALELYKVSTATLERVLGPEHPEATNAASDLATTYLQRGDLEAAETELRRVLPRLEARSPNDPWIAMMRGNLALVLEDLGKLEVAEVEWRHVMSVVEPKFGPESKEVAIAWHNHAGVLHKLGRTAEAEARYRQAIAAWEVAAPDDASAAMTRTRLAELLLEEHGSSAEALALAEAAWKRTSTAESDEEKGRAAFVLARALAASSRGRANRDRSLELGETSRAAYERAGNEERAAAVARWLREHSG